jgi:hypothetical protein
MGKEYARCDSGECVQRKPFPGRRQGAPTDPEPKDQIYRLESDDKKKCEGKCACFVVMQHVKKGDNGFEVAEEKAFPGKGKTGDESKLLDRQTKLDSYPERADPKGKANDHWRMLTPCLKTNDSGEPQTSLGFKLTLPEGQYLAARRELIERYGNSLDEISLVPALPASAPRRKAARKGTKAKKSAKARKPSKATAKAPKRKARKTRR